ncbi:hypothetical protein GCM10028808_39750 [Spirosoma migulaei]
MAAPSIELVEYVIVAVIVLLQIVFFVQTLITVRAFKLSLPEVSAFRLTDVEILEDDFRTVAPADLLNNLDSYVKKAKTARDVQTQKNIDYYQAQGLAFEEVLERASRDAQIQVDTEIINLLIVVDAPEGAVMSRIRWAINTYLIRNKGAVADFNLLRDIVQRHLDTLEEEIAISAPIPVYLGLTGTMLGIIIGLLSLPDVDSAEFIKNGIANLLGGVKIAMIASFIGLSLTVYTNGLVFRGAKNQVERRKNEFFTFLQTELLPILSESVNAGIVGLDRSLDRFGELFARNVASLQGLMNRNTQELTSLMDKNYEALMAQQQSVKALERIDITRVAKLNVNVLTQLREGTDALERLVYGLQQVDSFAANARALVDRSQDVVGLAEKISQTIEENRQLQHFLTGHFSQLEERGLLISDTVVRLDEVVDKSLTDLQAHIYERIQAVKQIQVQEEDLLKQEFSQNRGVLSKLNFLESLTETLSQYAKSDAILQGSVLGTIHQLKEETATTNRLLRQFISQAERPFYAKLFGRRNGINYVG